MKKILFVVNNLSGTVSQYNIKKCVEIFLDHEKYNSSLFYIDSETNPSEYISLFDKNYDIIVSVGGDGTLLEIGQNIIDKNITLGIIPIGSGNGLATHLGYKPREIENAFKAINSEKIVPIDVATINGEYFFSNFGYGIDALIAKDFKIKKKRSLLVYSTLTIKRILNIKPTFISYITDGKEYSAETYLFNVFNSNLFGYNVGLLPWASAFDGKLDLVYLRKASWWKFPFITLCILLKKPQWSSDLIFSEITDITIKNPNKIEYQVDGDPKLTKSDIQINILPSKLNVIVP